MSGYTPGTNNWEEDTKQFTRNYLKQHPEMAKPLKEKPPPTLFHHPAPTPANVREPGGKVIQWINDRCYLQRVDGTITDPFAMGYRVVKTCVGDDFSNPNMFDHLKPEYLKKPVEDICTRDKAGCTHSSSSSAQ